MPTDWQMSLGWTLLIVVAYPLLTLVVAEWSRRLVARQAGTQRALRAVQVALLPFAAIWLVVTKLTGLPSSALLARLADTAFGAAVLYTLLVIAHGIVASIAARSRAPRLLYDIALTILAMIGAALLISNVWGFSLASLLSAVGVGSVVMGLALQSVIGGMVSSVLLLSARKFGIGDWLSAGGATGRVVQVDWRSVTLQISPTERLVLPSSGLSAGAFSVIGAEQPAIAESAVLIGFEHAPERVRAMLLEAARNVPQLLDPDGATCTVREYGIKGIRYGVSLRVRDPGQVIAAQSELLSRIWYVAQRNGISVNPAEPPRSTRAAPTPEQRAEMLAACGVFRRPAAALLRLAETARLQHWRGGEIVLPMGSPVDTVLVIVQGSVCLFAKAGPARLELDCLGSGQVFAIREAFRGAGSPVELVAAGETELLSLPAQAVQDLLDRDPALAADLETVLESRAQALRNLVPLNRDPLQGGNLPQVKIARSR